MALDARLAALPAYARDMARNLEVLEAETVLTPQQKWGAFLASAHAVGVGAVIRAIEAEADLTPEARDAAKTAAAVMGMNNVYHRAIHLMANPAYLSMPARPRMSVAANPGVDKADFELWELAGSAINGCGACLDSHEEALGKHGVEPLAIQAALRIGAVVNAVSRVIAAEEAG